MNWVPEVASSFAGRVDAVLWFITIISLFFFFLISFFLVYFAVKYRRRRENEETPYIEGNVVLETIWTIVPSVLLVVIFVYGFVVYKDIRIPPAEATEINVTGKQWLWQFQYQNGKTTINELYLRHNRPVKLVHDLRRCLTRCVYPRLLRTKAGHYGRR
jgi:Heme/copper-type cytochrome/quinol oxidases, subunit 2